MPVCLRTNPLASTRQRARCSAEPRCFATGNSPLLAASLRLLGDRRSTKRRGESDVSCIPFETAVFLLFFLFVFCLHFYVIWVGEPLYYLGLQDSLKANVQQAGIETMNRGNVLPNTSPTIVNIILTFVEIWCIVKAEMTAGATWNQPFF